MKIIMILTNGFDPDPRVYKEAKTLVKAGHKVEILCWDREQRFKDKAHQLLEGIEIKRFFIDSCYGSGYKQILQYNHFRRQVKKYLTDKHFDAIHCHDFDGLYIGASICKARGKKLVYDQHDLLDFYFSNRPGAINKFIGCFVRYKEKALLGEVDTHIVVTDKMKELYSDKENIVTIYNSPEKDLFDNINKNINDRLTIGFIGSVRFFDQIRCLIDAAIVCKDNVNVLIAGRGTAVSALECYCKEQNCFNVRFTGSYHFSELASLYQQIDIMYSVYPKHNVVSMPNKFYESIITETPIIASSETEFGEKVGAEGFGFLVYPDSDTTGQLVQIMSNLIDNSEEIIRMKSNMAKKKSNYYWESNIPNLLNIYT